MNRNRSIFSVLAIVTVVLAMTVLASAQRRNSGYDPYYGRTNANIDYTVKNLRNNARRFQRTLDRELDRSRYDGSQREDYLNRLASRFKNAAEDLDDEYEGRAGRNSSYDEARRVINYGSQLDQALNRSRIGARNSTLRSSWWQIERDLGIIARAYNIRYSGRYGSIGRNGRYPNDRGRYGRYPNDQGRYGSRRGVNRNLNRVIRNLKYKAKRFENRVDDYEGRDRWGRRSNIGNLESLTDRFKNAVDRLDTDYDSYRDYDNNYDEVRRVLNIGSQVDREMSRTRVSRSLRNEWNSIEKDLRTLANAYNIRYNGRNGGYGIGDFIRNLPF